jgi:DNA-binding MarR family transcriptional regulator
VSVVVSRLADRGLVTRTVDGADRRRALVALTTAGRAAVRRAPRSARARFAEAANRLSPREQRAACTALERLADALDDGARTTRGTRV